MLIIVFTILTGLYLLGMGYLFYHWKTIRPLPATMMELPEGLLISVVVVVRNEEDHIKDLLNDLANQSIKPESFEVIVVNDHSSDHTCLWVEKLGYSLPLNLRLYHLSSDFGKKAGLELGVKRATGRYIAVTDGDCRISPNWLLTLFNTFYSRNAVFISGPVAFAGETGLFEKLQGIEFASLVGSGAALLQAGKPGMCNAANMAFVKAVFEEVGGMLASLHIPSGDDEFLLQSIFKYYPKQVFYLKSKEAIVATKAQENWKLFYQQRKRWAGKWRLHKNPFVALTALGVFFFHLSWIIFFLIVLRDQLTVGLSSNNPLLFYFFIGALFKFGTEFLFLQIVLKSLNKKLLLWPFIVLQLLYPVYVLIFGIAVNFGSFSWKGRTYKYTNV